MHIFAYFTRTLFHSDDGGTQLLSSYVPIDNLLWLGPRGRTRHGEIVHHEDDEDSEENAR